MMGKAFGSFMNRAGLKYISTNQQVEVGDLCRLVFISIFLIHTVEGEKELFLICCVREEDGEGAYRVSRSSAQLQPFHQQQQTKKERERERRVGCERETIDKDR